MSKFVVDGDGYQLEQQKKRYNQFVDRFTPKTGTVMSLSKSFAMGGFVCLIAQILHDFLALALPNTDQNTVATYTLMILVFSAIFLTGLGFYDDLGRIGGAGTFLPITGFANAMAASAMEFRTEGLVFGTSVKMFSIVGPVIVNGIVWSSLAGILHYLVMLFV